MSRVTCTQCGGPTHDPPRYRVGDQVWCSEPCIRLASEEAHARSLEAAARVGEALRRALR